MRKIFFVVSLILLTHVSRAANTFPVKELMASEMMIPLGQSGKYVSLEAFVNLTFKDYRSMTGKKLSLSEKIKLNISQRFLKKMIRKDGTINTEKLKRHGIFGKFQWHWGGFALGFFLSLLGPIVALFFNDDYKWDRFWTALHTATWIALLFTAIVAAAGGV